MTQEFKKKKEDFKCINCSCNVNGNGYTNHCPMCLYSKHVDIYPGDRGSQCGGVMVPVSVLQDHGKYIIVHECHTCGHKKKNKMQKGDNFDAILSVLQ